jgi:hypothetical protein
MGANLVLKFREQHRLKLFEKRMLMAPKWDEVTREWGKLPSDELRCLCSLQKFIRVIKSRKTGWAANA